MKPASTTKRRGVGWFFKTLFILALAGTALGTLGAGIAFLHFSSGLPKLITAADYRPLGVTRVYSDNGKGDVLLGEIEPKERRYLIPFDKIPDLVVKAFIAAEDDSFYEHQGINLASIIRAAIANFKAGHTVQGGSTITMQVVKSLLLTPERSFTRKFREAILASRIERNLTKQQILYLYLNQIYLGHGAYGVQAAARSYFRKDVSNLTIAEAALLAGLPQAPGKYSPLLSPKRAKERQLYVLRRLYESKFISQSQMSEAAAQPIPVYEDEDHAAKPGAYLLEHVRRYLLEKYGEKAVYEEGLTVTVPAPLALSAAARKALREGLREIDKRMGFRGPIQHLKSTDEIEKTLREQRMALIRKKLGHTLLLPDGRLDAIEAMHAAGIPTDAQLLEPGEVYRAVVTSIDDRRKTAGVMIGAAKADLPLERLKWARPAGPAARGEPTAVSRVLAKGDVILVRAEKITGNIVEVGLDQDPQVQGAVFSLDAQTGNVLAMEGGYDFGQSEFNRAIQAMRQPGSAFKPILYSAALGKGFTPASVIVDSPIVYGDDENGKWKPTNFEEKFYGDTTFRQALIKSRNVPTIKIVQAIQLPYLIDFTKRLGMNATLPSDLSISLGSASVSLWELTRTYALFPRLGRRVQPIVIASVRDRDGQMLEENKPTLLPPSPRTAAPENLVSPLPNQPAAGPSFRQELVGGYPLAEDPDQVMDPRIAYVMTNLMKEVVSYGTGYRAKELGRVAAGKTGTTNDSIDAWFLGFTPNVVTGVWVGFDSQKAMGSGETGAKAALPIWVNYMREAVKGYPEADFNSPPGVVLVSIDPATGKRVSPNASNSIKEAFIEGTEPPEASATAVPTGGSRTDFLKEDIE